MKHTHQAIMFLSKDPLCMLNYLAGVAESGLAQKPRKNAQDLRSCGLAPS